MELWKKIKHGRKLNKAINKVKKESKNWLCSPCKKKATTLTKQGHNFVDLILNSEEHFCDKCKVYIQNLLKDYSNWT